jgi:hypothetical protein
MRSFTRCFSFLCTFFLTSSLLFGQVVVTFPSNRIVLQRDNANKATMQIAGNYYQPLDRVEARFIPVVSGWGTGIDWFTVQENPVNGAFSGAVVVSGGWYTLEVRGIFGGNVVTSYKVDRVGVGEVFVVAGQSNAQGVLNPNQSIHEPQDDRVNAVNDFYDNGFSSDPNYPVFSKMTANGHIAPYGMNGWAWGALGDVLAKRLNVPVLFFNGALAATTIKNWRESSQGLRTSSRYRIGQPDELFPAGQPYGNLKVALQYYVSLTGVRAVLWEQGEADGYPLYTPKSDYLSDLSIVIGKTREHLGKDVAWVVARTSYTFGQTWQGLIDAQTEVTRTLPGVYMGPYTDLIETPRKNTADAPGFDAHFSPDGLLLLGNAWSEAMNNQFFATSNPIPARNQFAVYAACAPNNAQTLAVADKQIYSWNSGQSTASITVGQGVYIAKSRTANGNTEFSLPYKVPDRPVVGGSVQRDPSSGAAYYCAGVTPLLQSNYNANNTWNTGAVTPSILGTVGSSYSLKFKDVMGCEYSSETITLTQRPQPAKPSIKADGAASFCEGTPRVLSTAETNTGYLWNNGETTKDIQPKSSRYYSVKVADANRCYSISSDSIQIQVNPIPAKPTIQANRTIDGSRTVTICANENVELTSSPSDGSYKWSYNNQSSISISVNLANSYQVQTVSKFDCISPVSDPIFVRVNPIPNKPTVNVVRGKLAFCEGSSVTLQAVTTQKASWILGNTEVSNNALLTATISGDYYAQAADANNCKNYSDKVTVSSRPNPQTPAITQVGPYTLEASSKLPGSINSWYIDNDTITYKSLYLKPLKEGVYRVKAAIEYDVAPVGKFTCYSGISAPFTYAYDPKLEDGFSLYPNPSPDGNFTLETKENWIDAEITVFTVTGVQLYQGKVAEFNERKFIYLGRLPGMYILRIKNKNNERTRRIAVAPY